tara:strand:- start:31 stop:651 length:621 start_codon:yes stop_codon:yes gene_type:complete
MAKKKSDYDYTSAYMAKMFGVDLYDKKSKHWGSRVPNTPTTDAIGLGGRILKSQDHSTFDKTVAGEAKAKHNLASDKNRNLISIPGPSESNKKVNKTMAKKKSKTIPAKTKRNSPVNFENHNRSSLAREGHIALGGLEAWAKRTSEGPPKIKVTPAAAKRRKATDAIIAANKSTPAEKAKRIAALEAKKAKSKKNPSKKKITKKGK